MSQKRNMLLRSLLVVVCALVFFNAGPFACAADDYFVYSKFTAPGSGLVFSAGGYVEDYGVPGTWGDEIQYVYFIQAGTPRLAYKVKVWVTNEGSVDDPTPYIDIRQHPDHYDPDHVGPIEPRHFEIISTCDVTAYSDDGGLAAVEFQVDATGVYLGPWFGIFKFDHNWNYLGQIAPAAPRSGAGPASLAYDPERNTWFTCTHIPRDVFQISDTDNDGDLMDETWQYIFSSPSYGGSHHDGMEYVGGYLWISDMTSDVIGKWQYDSGTDTWSEVGVYYYSEAAVVEGMGFGANDKFWIAGFGHRYVYELGDEITMYYPIADAGEDVDSYPPTIPLDFDASGSHHTDPERDIVLYEWDFDGDGVYDYSGTDPVVEHAYPAYYLPDGTIDWDATAKCYTAVLRVTDDDPVTPKTAADIRTVCITRPPWKPITDPDGPYNTRVNQEVCLDGSGSFHPAAEMHEPGHPWYDEIVLWEWDLDNDGEFDDATGEIVCTQWPAEGTYFVCLRVTDLVPTPGSPEMDVDEKCTTVIVSTIHDVAVESVIPSKSSVAPGEEVTIDVTVSNLGDYPESFDVTVVYDGVEIGVDNVTGLAPGGDEELQFTWDTTGVPKGTYTVKACAEVVPGEIIIQNNCQSSAIEVINEIQVAVDIKPTSCPNPLNVGINGVLPVAIVGTYDFNVTQVDPGTITLVGVDPLRYSYEDVCTPYYPLTGKKKTQLSCTEEGPDGFLDLTLKFDMQQIVEALGKVADQDVLVLTLEGKLFDEYGGVPIVGEDVVIILKKGK